MKKGLRKALIVLLSVMMVLGMSMTVFAEGEPSVVDLTIHNGTNMFKAVTASLETVGADRTLTVALSGTGYHELFLGTYEDAVANGANTENWIHGYENAEGKWEFKVPIAKEKEFLPIIAISDKYYKQYLAGEEPIERCFYARMLKVDSEAKTLDTDDYTGTIQLTVDNQVKMFKPGKVADLTTIGGPNNNAYGHYLTLHMESTSFSKVRLKDEEEEILLNDNNDFENIDVTEHVDGEEFTLEFWSVNNERWYKRNLAIDVPNKKATFTVYPGDAIVQEIAALPDVEAAKAYAKEKATPQFTDLLIEAIQVQVRDDNTDKLCAAAKAAWDTLTDAQKEEVEEYDYFGLDTGDASKDDPLNTAPDKEQELLVVSFGTSFNDSRVATIGAVEKALAKAFPEYAVRRAFTAQIIINHVQARDGEQIDNVKQAMDKAVAAGVKKMIVQPTHLMSGAEYDELKKEIDTYADKIDISYTKPLLDSDSDKEIVAKAVVAAAAKDAGFASVEAAIADKDTAFVFMGHGTAHEAKATYTYMQETMNKLEYKNCFIGTVEGEPEETAVEAILASVQAAGYKKVVLRPLMVVAGDHANNDMAGDDEDSWKSIFAAALGAENVSCQIKGLGELEEIQSLYIDHTLAVIPGVELTVENKFSMFKPTAAELKGNILLLTYASESYDKAYVGTDKEAALLSDPSKLAVRKDGVYRLPLDSTEGKIYVAFHSVKNQGWYGRIFEIDKDANKLTTDTTGGALVPDSFGNDWDEEVSVVSSLGMLKILATKVTVEDDGTATIKMKVGASSRDFCKIALIEQTASVEEKEAVAIVGTPVAGEDHAFIYEFSVPVEKLGTAVPMSNYQISKGVAEWHNWENQHTLTLNSVTVVNRLIESIQKQSRDEYTDILCTTAKAAWEALSEEDKEKDDGYFSEDTGDASKDDPLNTAPDKDKELLVVSFGTSYNGSRVATIGAVEKALATAFPGYAVRRAFTAQIIINHVQARDGEFIDNVKQAMDKAVAAGVKEMIVQPTHLMSGAEYDELKKEIDTYKDKISISYAKPLLDSDSDKETVAKEVVAAAAKDAGFPDVKTAVADKETAFVFMGHGTAHAAKATYTYMQQTMDKLGYKNCFIGTVEGEPEETEVNAVLAKVQAAGYKKVVLRPLMVVAGDHANNDMAGGDAESWKSIFAAALGAENVSCQIKGLGEIEAVQKLYVSHTQAVIDAPAIAKVKNGKIKSFKAKAGKKKVTFTWKKNTTFSGYQLKYKVGKKTKTVNIKSAKTVKKVIKKLKKGKKVSAQIRGYKKISGKTYYGKWAKSKTVKVK